MNKRGTVFSSVGTTNKMLSGRVMAENTADADEQNFSVTQPDEQKLRYSEEQQAFLLKLSDALRPLSEAVEIASVAAKRLGEFCGMRRVFYAEIAGSQMRVERDYTDGVDSMVGEHDLQAFGPEMLGAYKDGAVIKVKDTQADPRLNQTVRDGLQQRQVGAYVDVVLFEEDERVSIMAVQSTVARAWTVAEVNLFREVGERVKSAIELARAEEALRESEGRFRDMANNLPVVIWITDAEGRFTYLNKRWSDFTGQSTKAALGSDWLECVHPDDKQRAWQSFVVTHKAKQSFSIEYRLRQKNGKYRWVIDTGVPQFNHDDKFSGYLGTLMDIEDMVQRQVLEQKTDFLTREREQLIKLSQAKDEFISLASHQLRTPATSVKQYVGMLLEGYAGDLSNQQTQMLKTAHVNNDRQLGIIDDLLRIARLDAGKVVLKRKRTNLGKMLNWIFKDCQSIFNTRWQTLSFKPPAQPIYAQVDERHLRMVIENLLDNASKYTPEGKTIRISLKQKPSAVEIKVSDEGIGIAKKDMKNLFQKFARVDSPLSVAAGGTGLGLYWVKKIIDLHGGQIIAKSKPAQGSTFTIVLSKTKE